MSSPDLLPMDASTPPAAASNDEALTEGEGFPKHATSFYYFYAGIVTPLICFSFAAWVNGQPLIDSWQSGNFDVYASLMLTLRAGWPFYPLLLYCMTAIGCYAAREKPGDERFWVRLGLYGGALLAWQYVFLVYFAGSLSNLSRDLPLALVCLMVMIPIATALAVVLALFGGLLTEAVKSIGWLKTGAAFILTLLLAASAAVNGVSSMQGVFFYAMLFVVAPGPIFAALAYSFAAYQVASTKGRYRFRLSHLLAGTGWAAAHLAAWRKSMDLAIEAYNQLPTDPPQCYVCTAAARGHARFVKSRPVVVVLDGRAMPVNDQLQTLKAAELALAIAAPRFHRGLRCLYNQVGPPLARRLSNPWSADAAYVSLKPAEWLARFVLRRVLRVDAAQIRRLYESPRH